MYMILDIPMAGISGRPECYELTTRELAEAALVQKMYARKLVRVLLIVVLVVHRACYYPKKCTALTLHRDLPSPVDEQGSVLITLYLYGELHE